MDPETNNLYTAFTLLHQSKPFWQCNFGHKNYNPILLAGSVLLQDLYDALKLITEKSGSALTVNIFIISLKMSRR